MYKDDSDKLSELQKQTHRWLQSLLEIQSESGDALEFLEHIKVDLFPDEVYVFSPRGKIFALPKGATAIDFAYAVHTDVGNHAVAARVDKKLVPLRAKLVSGQTVEIITAPSASPGPQWLDFVVSSKARTAIRHFLKRLEHEDAVDLGHRMLDRALEARESSLDRVPQDRIEQFLLEHRYRRLEELLADIALGNRMPAQVAATLYDETPESVAAREQRALERRLARPLGADLGGRRHLGAVRKIDSAVAAGARGAGHRGGAAHADRAGQRHPQGAGRPALQRRHRHLREGLEREPCGRGRPRQRCAAHQRRRAALQGGRRGRQGRDIGLGIESHIMRGDVDIVDVKQEPAAGAAHDLLDGNAVVGKPLMVAVTGYQGYVPEKAPKVLVAARGCAFNTRTVAMTFGQTLDVVSKDGEAYVPTLLGSRMSALAFPAPRFLARGWDWLVGRGRWVTRWAVVTGERRPRRCQRFTIRRAN